MAPTFEGFKQIDSACGLFGGTQKTDKNRIQYWQWTIASGQVELENQKSFNAYL